MINFTADFVIFTIAAIMGVLLLIKILIDVCGIIKDFVMYVMEKYFPRLYYYDYDDEA